MIEAAAAALAAGPGPGRHSLRSTASDDGAQSTMEGSQPIEAAAQGAASSGASLGEAMQAIVAAKLLPTGSGRSLRIADCGAESALFDPDSERADSESTG